VRIDARADEMADSTAAEVAHDPTFHPDRCADPPPELADAATGGQLDRIGGLADYERLQHRDAVDQALDVAHDCPGLAPVGSNDGQRPDLARGQNLSVVAEASQEDRDDGRDPRFAAPTADDNPGFLGRGPWWRLTARVRLEECDLVFREWLAEKGG